MPNKFIDVKKREPSENVRKGRNLEQFKEGCRNIGGDIDKDPDIEDWTTCEFDNLELTYDRKKNNLYMESSNESAVVHDADIDNQGENIIVQGKSATKIGRNNSENSKMDGIKKKLREHWEA